MNIKKDGIVIYAFPASGKTTLAKKYKNVIDLESSDFHWVFDEQQKSLSTESRKGLLKVKNPEWPKNYFNAILKAVKEYDFVLVSHQGMQECSKNNIPYWLIYPKKECKDEYIQRMRSRGNNEEFVDKLQSNFEKFVDDCIADENAEIKIELDKGDSLESKLKELELL